MNIVTRPLHETCTCYPCLMRFVYGTPTFPNLKKGVVQMIKCSLTIIHLGLHLPWHLLHLHLILSTPYFPTHPTSQAHNFSFLSFYLSMLFGGFSIAKKGGGTILIEFKRYVSKNRMSCIGCLVKNII